MGSSDFRASWKRFCWKQGKNKFFRDVNGISRLYESRVDLSIQGFERSATII